MARKGSLEQKMEMYLANDALGRENAALKARIGEMEAELAEAREDSERLDAVQRGSWTIHYRSMNSRWELLTDHAHPAHRKTYTGKTARAAIDAARKGE